MPIAPFPLTLIICDQIYHETTTGKYSLLGCFNTISVRTFPARHPELAVYGTLTDVGGEIEILVKLVHTPSGQLEERELLVVPVPVRAPDRRAIVEFAVTLRDVTFPEPGEYRIQMGTAQGPLMEQRLFVRRMAADLG